MTPVQEVKKKLKQGDQSGDPEVEKSPTKKGSAEREKRERGRQVLSAVEVKVES